MKQTYTRRALTLVEVLAVLVILGLMAGTFAVGFSGIFDKSKQELAKTAIGTLQSKLESYKIEHDQWPSMDVGLEALSDGHASPTDTYYVSPDKLIDPWGHPYQYVMPGPNGHPYEILCLGADHTLGGTNENSDLSSTNLRKNETDVSG